MAKIERKTQKVFAGSASNNGQFGSAQAGTKVTSTDPDVLQALSAFDSGWATAVLGGENLPTLEEAQALHYMETRQIGYVLQEGIPEYDAGTEYHQKSIVKKVGTYELYGSLIDTNTGNALPSQTDNASWQYLGDLADLKDAGSATVPDASTTVSGVVEIATDAEVTAETATGGTGASLVATPANMKKHQGVAKAWVNINNSDAIVDDYNISSLTDFGVSGYTLNFTNAMANTNYIVVGSGNIANNGSTIQCGIFASDSTVGTPVTKTTSAVRVNVIEVNTNTHIPWLNTSFAIFGD